MKKTILTSLAITAALPMLAQEVQYRTPEKLSSFINSEAEEVMPVFTRNGQTMYYVRAFHESNVGGENTGHDIWMSNRTQAGTWENAVNVEALNNTGSNAVIGISNDGNTLYLMNSYTEGMKTEPGISMARREGSGWSTPVDIPIPGLTPSTRLYGFFVTPDENAIFISMENESSLGKEDLFVSMRDPAYGWTVPINLGPDINTADFEISPYISPDGRKLFFSSNRSGGYGDADIYMSERVGNSWTSWTTPVNLGSRINSSSFDAYFTMLNDSTVFFASSREGNLSDIYRSRLEPIPAPVVVKKPRAGEKPTYIFFEFDKYSLTNQSKETLNKIQDTLNQLSEYTVILEGHTDHIGTDAYNIRLGQNRANSASKYLKDRGISSNRITTENYGESQPMAPNTHADGSDNPEGRALNRRVVIRLIPPSSVADTADELELP